MDQQSQQVLQVVLLVLQVVLLVVQVASLPRVEHCHQTNSDRCCGGSENTVGCKIVTGWVTSDLPGVLAVRSNQQWI